jgi:hypothetical protein
VSKLIHLNFPWQVSSGQLLVQEFKDRVVALLIGLKQYGIVIGTFDIYSLGIWYLTDHPLYDILREQKVILGQHPFRGT